MSDLKQAALDYHESIPFLKVFEIALTKSTESAHDLALAYSPGVAEPVREIAKDPENAYRFHGQGQSGGGDFKWFRHSGSWQSGAVGVQARDGGQVRSV